jgi:hypothetical protein
MVNGMESFRTKFIDYPDCYTVIGGAACDILMSEADVPFRATKDIDMILLLEDRYQDFAKVFWEYIKEGGYRCGWKNSKDVHFYRFTDPVPGYPVQIELFSRFPDYHLRTDSGIIPIHINDDISSLSAILLNDDFYGFMMQGRRNIDGISVLDASYLIPFKMRAWIDLSDRKARGEHVNEKDLKKHKYDVFRLLEIVTPDETVKVIGMVKDSINAFLDRIQEEELPLAQIGLSINKDQSIQHIQNLYKQ